MTRGGVRNGSVREPLRCASVCSPGGTQLRSEASTLLRQMTRAHLLVVAALALVPFALTGCGPDVPPLTPSSEPSTASADEEGAIAVTLLPPAGDWLPNAVEVENARLVSRDGDEPLRLTLERSKPKQGETTVLGADEPIKITVIYLDKKTRAKGRLVFLVDAPPEPKAGAKITVTTAL